MIYRQSIVLGAVFIVASEFMLASMGAVIKTAAVGLPNEMIVFFRNLFGLLVLAPWLWQAGRAYLRTHVPHLHVLRGVAGVSAMYCFFYAIGHIKLADAMLFKLTSPLFIPVVAFFWLSERMAVAVRWALVVGFVGVILVLQPGEHIDPVMLIALAGSVLAALAKTTVRRLSTTEPALRVVFYFAVVALGVSAVPLLWAWQTPTTEEWLLLVLVGVLATLGQLFMTRGYGAAPASQVGVYTYSAVLFGAAYGWLIWGETWDMVSFAGAILVVLAGALALRGRTRPTDF